MLPPPRRSGERIEIILNDPKINTSATASAAPLLDGVAAAAADEMDGAARESKNGGGFGFKAPAGYYGVTAVVVTAAAAATAGVADAAAAEEIWREDRDNIKRSED